MICFLERPVSFGPSPNPQNNLVVIIKSFLLNPNSFMTLPISSSDFPLAYPSAVSNMLIPFSKAILMISFTGSPVTVPPSVNQPPREKMGTLRPLGPRRRKGMFLGSNSSDIVVFWLKDGEVVHWLTVTLIIYTRIPSDKGGLLIFAKVTSLSEVGPVLTHTPVKAGFHLVTVKDTFCAWNM